MNITEIVVYSVHTRSIEFDFAENWSASNDFDIWRRMALFE